MESTFKELKEKGQERKTCDEKIMLGPLDRASWRALCTKVTCPDLLFDKNDFNYSVENFKEGKGQCRTPGRRRWGLHRVQEVDREMSGKMKESCKETMKTDHLGVRDDESASENLVMNDH